MSDALRRMIIAALDRELTRQAEANNSYYLGGPLPVDGEFPATYDGDLYLGELTDAIIAAIGPAAS